MTVSFTRRQRSLLLFLSASGYVAWFSGLGDRLEAQDIASTPAPAMTFEHRAFPPRVATVITRDPFSGSPVEKSVAAEPRDDTGGEAARSAHRDTSAPNGSATDDAGLVVPNIGDARVAAATVPAQQATLTLRIRATIIGPSPVAYVENGSVMDIVRVGDLLGERRIAKIDLRGLAFNDGSRLDLPGSFTATPSPARGGSAITIKLDDLKRLLTRQTASQQPLTPAATVSATAQPAPTSTFPTPGPLPTVDARGLPVGVNPTSNPGAPTPYPNPYPYAPAHVPH